VGEGQRIAELEADIKTLPAAPTQGRIAPNTSNAVPTWKTQIVALLERNKRYPEAAQSRRQQGIAQVFFRLDRQGRVIDSRVVRSSGASALDEEALALLRRAQPFPPPPPELPGERVDLTVPIRFNLK
jgi:protein TonB